jgi:hypothetical protein
VIHGAALLYNFMLAKLLGKDDLIESYQSNMDDWASTIETREPAISSWDRQRFWGIVRGTGARTTPQTRHFIDRWFSLVIDGGTAGTIRENQEARQLILERERALKRGQARLDNRRALELWGGAAGTAQLNYRWPRVAHRIVTDILNGMEGS